MCCRRNQGRKCSANNPWYPCALRVPETANKGLFLDTETAPQNITFSGNFDLATFGQHPFLCHARVRFADSWIVVSSEKNTLLLLNSLCYCAQQTSFYF